MVSQTNEQALEAAIEKKLTGTTREAIKEQIEWATLGDQLISSIRTFLFVYKVQICPRAPVVHAGAQFRGLGAR